MNKTEQLEKRLKQIEDMTNPSINFFICPVAVQNVLNEIYRIAKGK